jgi:UDP-glucose 4-epimerase
MGAWLLTGGAGYIGGHVLRVLQESGREVVVVDDLSTGRRSRVPADVPLVECSILDTARLRASLKEYAVEGVVHLAAKKSVGESVERPLRYFEENVGGLVSLLAAMRDEGVARLVYSSSAAVYGTPARSPVVESSPTVPQSPYGQTKLVGEWLVADAAREFELSWVALRYFNVAGAGKPELGDTGVFNLIPIVLRATSTGQSVPVFGTDYPTRDGSCVRDYIHVADLADAHLGAADRCLADGVGEVFNVGRGTGVSVLEVLAGVSDLVGHRVEWHPADRRPGDPPSVVAAVGAIRDALGWEASRGLPEMLASAWEAWQLSSSPAPAPRAPHDG